jgi:hypothetical protein
MGNGERSCVGEAAGKVKGSKIDAVDIQGDIQGHRTYFRTMVDKSIARVHEIRKHRAHSSKASSSLSAKKVRCRRSPRCVM